MAALEETAERLRLEVEELRGSRERLVLAADADRRRLERDLHDGLQQLLVALTANLQFLDRLVDGDSDSARRLIGELKRDLRRALEETQRLAERIYPPLIGIGGLAASLRAAFAGLGIPARVEVAPEVDGPSRAATAVYFCTLAALRNAVSGSRATVAVREEQRSLVFDLTVDLLASAPATVVTIRDRVEALGGRLSEEHEPGGGLRVQGSIPLAR